MNSRLVSLFIFLIALCCYGALILQSPLPFEVIDRDSSGLISVSEAIDSLDVGHRIVEVNGVSCVEYYWLKDGLPVNTNCKQS